MEFEYYRFGVQFLCTQFDTSTYLRVAFDWLQSYFCKNVLISMSLHQNVPHGFEVLFSISGECVASFSHVLKFSGFPPVPKPILESQLLQCFLWSEIMPALALE